MKNKKFWIILASIIIIFAIIYFFAQNQISYTEKEEEIKNGISTYTDISAEQAKTLIDENPELIIIDVSPNYNQGHLPGAINYYVGDESLDNAIPSLDKDLTYLIYCHVASASKLGAQKLIDAGFENVYRLDGDYNAWVNAGYEIEQ